MTVVQPPGAPPVIKLEIGHQIENQGLKARTLHQLLDCSLVHCLFGWFLASGN
jgi:hypothetical protein